MSQRGGIFVLPKQSDENLMIANRVKEALKEDKNLRSYDLNVRCVDGVVTIQGVVDVLAEKSHAAKVAEGVEGVRAVENRLTVCSDGAIKDSDVMFEISEEINANDRLDLKRIEVDVKDGVAMLRGSVDSLADKREFEETVSKARGVKDIVSDIRVSPGDDPDDATISNRVSSTILHEVGNSGGEIRVRVDQGRLQLNGDITDMGLKERLIEAVEEISGVNEVVDRLEVSPDLGERIAAEFHDALKRDPLLYKAPIDVSMVKGNLVIEGELAGLDQKRALERVIDQFSKSYPKGIVGIDNRAFLRESAE